MVHFTSITLILVTFLVESWCRELRYTPLAVKKTSAGKFTNYADCLIEFNAEFDIVKAAQKKKKEEYDKEKAQKPSLTEKEPKPLKQWQWPQLKDNNDIYQIENVMSGIAYFEGWKEKDKNIAYGCFLDINGETETLRNKMPKKYVKDHGYVKDKVPFFVNIPDKKWNWMFVDKGDDLSKIFRETDLSKEIRIIIFRETDFTPKPDTKKEEAAPTAKPTEKPVAMLSKAKKWLMGSLGKTKKKKTATASALLDYYNAYYYDDDGYDDLYYEYDGNDRFRRKSRNRWWK